MSSTRPTVASKPAKAEAWGLSPRITAIVFDVGNVLVPWDIHSLYAPLIPDADELTRFCGEVVTPEWHFQHDAGRPVQETMPELIRQFPQHEALIRQFEPRWMDSIGPAIAGMEQLLNDLDVAKIPLFAITNFSMDFWPRFVAQTPMIGKFRDVVVSGAHSIVKPDPAIYALALKRFKLVPDSAVFIDDRLDNIDAARASGFVGHHFKTAEILREDLVQLGCLGR
jgi:2-haloacid dehalogenase